MGWNKKKITQMRIKLNVPFFFSKRFYWDGIWNMGHEISHIN